MLILSQIDLKYLLNPAEKLQVFSHLKCEGDEVLLFSCPYDSLYLGYLATDFSGVLSFEDFVPSVVYRNLYCDLPDRWVGPCPLCSNHPSIVRLKNSGGGIRVYSS